MHREKYWGAKVPLALAITFVINLLLVIGMECLLLYKCPLPLTADTLADFDSSYENCRILDTFQQGKLHCCLVETDSGQIHMIPFQGHSLAASRSRILKKYITVVPEQEQITVPVRIGAHTSQIIVSPEPIPGSEFYTSGLYVSIYYSQSNSGTLYMVLAGILAVLELGFFQLLKQNLQ